MKRLASAMDHRLSRSLPVLPPPPYYLPPFTYTATSPRWPQQRRHHPRHYYIGGVRTTLVGTHSYPNPHRYPRRLMVVGGGLGAGTVYHKITRHSSSVELSHSGVFTPSSTEDLRSHTACPRKALSCEDVSRSCVSAWDCRLSESGVSLGDSRTDLASCSGDLDGASQCSFGSSSAFLEMTADSELDGRPDSAAGSVCGSERTVDGENARESRVTDSARSDSTLLGEGRGEVLRCDSPTGSNAGSVTREMDISDGRTCPVGDSTRFHHSTPIKRGPPCNQTLKDYASLSPSDNPPYPEVYPTNFLDPPSHVKPFISALPVDGMCASPSQAESVPASIDTAPQRTAIHHHYHQYYYQQQQQGKKFTSLQDGSNMAEQSAGACVESWLTTGHTHSIASVTLPPSLISERDSFSRRQQHQPPVPHNPGVSLPSPGPRSAAQIRVGESVRVVEQGPILQITDGDCRDNTGRAQALVTELCREEILQGQPGAGSPVPTVEGVAGGSRSYLTHHPAPDVVVRSKHEGQRCSGIASGVGGDDEASVTNLPEEIAPTASSPVCAGRTRVEAGACAPSLSDARTINNPRPASSSGRLDLSLDRPWITDDATNNPWVSDGTNNSSSAHDVTQQTGRVTGQGVNLSRDSRVPPPSFLSVFHPPSWTSERLESNAEEDKNTSACSGRVSCDADMSYRATLFSERSGATRREEDALKGERKEEEKEREEKEEEKKEDEGKEGFTMSSEVTSADTATASPPSSTHVDSSCGGPALATPPLYATVSNYAPVLPSTHTPLRPPVLPGGDDQQVGLSTRQQQQQWRGVPITTTQPSAAMSTPEQAEEFSNRHQPSARADERPGATRIHVESRQHTVSPALSGEGSRRRSLRKTTTTTITTTTTVTEEKTVVTTRHRLRHSSASPTAQGAESCVSLLTASSASADAASAATKERCDWGHSANRPVSPLQHGDTAEKSGSALASPQQSSPRWAAREERTKEKEGTKQEEGGDEACPSSPPATAVVPVKSVAPGDGSGNAHLSPSSSQPAATQQQQQPQQQRLSDHKVDSACVMAATGGGRINASLDLLDSLQQQLSLLSCEDVSSPVDNVYTRGSPGQGLWYRDHAEASLPGVSGTENHYSCVEGRGRVSITLAKHGDTRAATETGTQRPASKADHLSSHGSSGPEFQRENSSPFHGSVNTNQRNWNERGEVFSGDEWERGDEGGAFPPLRSQLSLWRPPPSSSSDLDDSDGVYTSISTTDSDPHAESDLISSDGYGAEEYDNVDSFHDFVSGLQGQYTSDRPSHPHHHRADTMCGRLRPSIQETILEADDESETADEADTTANTTVSSFKSSFHFSLPQSSSSFHAVSPVPEIRLWSTDQQVTSLAMSESSGDSKADTLSPVHPLQDLSDRLASFEDTSFELHTLHESYTQDLDASSGRHSACGSPDPSDVSEGCLYSDSAVAEVRTETKIHEPVEPIYKLTEKRSSTPVKTPRKSQWVQENVLLFQKLVNELEKESRPPEQSLLEEMCSLESARGGDSGEKPEDQKGLYGELYRCFTREQLEKRQSHVCPFAEDHLPVLRFKRFLRKKHNSKLKGRRTIRVRHVLDSVREAPCVSESVGSMSESDLTALTHTDDCDLSHDGDSSYHQHTFTSSARLPVHRPLSDMLSDDTDVKISLSDSAYSTLSDATSRHVSDLDSSLTRSACSSHCDVTSFVTDLSVDSDKMTSLGDVFDQFDVCEGEIDQALLDRLHVGHYKYKADTL